MTVRTLLSALLLALLVLLRTATAWGFVGFLSLAHAQVASQAVAPGVVTVASNTQKINLRHDWLEKVLPKAHGMSPDTLLALPTGQFVANTGQIAANLPNGKTLLLRTQIQFEPTDKAWVLEIPVARLDEVFVHYRFAGSGWQIAHMGDKVAYKEWPFINQHPAMPFVVTGNTMDLLLEVGHAGRFTSAVWIKPDAVFRTDRLRYGILDGLVIGFMLAMALVCAASWRAFGNGAFNWVAVQLLMFAFAVAAYLGYGDMFIWGDASPWWRDQSKLISTMFLLAVMPPLFTSVLGLRTTDTFVWSASLVAGFLILVIGCVMAVYLPAHLRVTGAAGLSLLVLSSATWLCIAAHRRGDRIAPWLSMCFAMYAFCIIATAVDNLVRIEWVEVPHVAPLGYALGSLVLTYGLFANHRFGKAVFAQEANPNHLVDELTGLPNRDGLAKEYAHHVLQLRAQHATAVFILIRLTRAAEIAEEQGREQFEQGVIDLAASLVGCLAPGETMARLDDATFAIVASEHNDSASADQLASQLLARCMAAQTPGREVQSRLVALPIPSGGSMADTVIHKCESALLAAPASKRIIKLHANGQQVHSGIESV